MALVLLLVRRDDATRLRARPPDGGVVRWSHVVRCPRSGKVGREIRIDVRVWLSLALNSLPRKVHTRFARP